jgi:hypothetical protein
VPTEAGEYHCLHRATNFAGTTTKQSSAVAVTTTPDPGPDPDPDPAPQPVEFDRKLTLRYSERTDKFSGKLGSSEEECRSGRVVLFKVKPGKDKRIGSDLASASGTWLERSKNASGKYYVTSVRHDLTGGYCPAVKSKTLRVG